MGIIGDKKMVDTKTTATESKTRNKRRPFGVPQSKLAISKQLDGWHYRWINDSPGRIAQALEGDYVFAEPAEVGRADNGESRVKELAGTNKDGSAMYAYLMRIPQEFFEEDRTNAQGYLDEIDNAIRGGSVGQTAADKRYVPKDGISIKTK
jgi:hypothetical protein